MRKSLRKVEQLAVWNRDSWHCRYCLAPVFFSPALKELDRLSPGHSYYHRNNKSGQMLPLLLWTWASVDHLVPVALGGTNALDNLVTACWRCNLDKRDRAQDQSPQTQSIPPQIEALRWDGLFSVYLKLVEKDDEWSRLARG